MEKVIKTERAKNSRHKRRLGFVWPPAAELPRCSHCFKPEGVCFCPDIEVNKSTIEIVILQHPSEARNPESTARLGSIAWQGAQHFVGLSWPSLSKLLGETVNSQEWAVVYLGGKKDGRELTKHGNKLVSRGGEEKELRKLKGLIFIDGNWRQSKTLWWRNPWLGRLSRLVLSPEAPSQYSELRRQPRKECLSTVEAIGQALSLVGKQEAPRERMEKILQKHLTLVQEFKRSFHEPLTASPSQVDSL